MAFLIKGSARWWYIVVAVAVIQFAPAISTFVPSFRSRRNPQAHISKVDAPLPYLTSYAGGQCILSASTSSSTEENVVKFIEGSSIPNNKTSTPKEENYQEIDKMLLVNQTENTQLGLLTQDSKRDMLTLMRQLSSMGRRQDDMIGSTASNKKDAASRRQDAIIVERLLDRLLKEYQYSTEFSTDDNNGRQRTKYTQRDNINARTYNLAIKAWANANVRGSAEKAERVLKRLKIANINNDAERPLSATTKSTSLSSSLHPDIYSFAYCYAAWYKESIFAATNIGNMKASSSAMRKAESVLQSMKQVLMKEENKDGSSNTLSHSSQNIVEDVNSLLVLWSNTNIHLPDLSEKFVRFIHDESGETNDTWLNVRSYNLVINAWAKSLRPEAVSRAEALLKQMEESTSVSPDLLSYSGVISCVSKSKRNKDIKKAEDVLQRVSNMDGVQPDNVIFNQVLNIYSKRGIKGSADQCEKMVQRMEQQKVVPDIRTYNILLTAYANEKGATAAEKILQRIEKHPSINPDAISYTTCMDSYAKIGDAHNSLRILSLMEKSFQSGNVQAKPTRRAYISALNSLAKSGRGDAGARAEALVQTMERMAKSNPELKPDTTVYNVLINCHKNSAARAEKVLYRMGKRDVVSYSSVINIHSKVGGIKAAKRAQELLDEMQNEDVAPNAYTFNSAISAWSRAGGRGAAQKAEALLNKMEKLYEAGNANLQPSAQIYTSVITAWARSNEPGSALRAEILLKLMWAMYKRDANKDIKPNAHTFSSVINAWSTSRQKDAGERAERLLDTMIKLYEKGDTDVKPNVFTFTSVIHAYARAGARGAASTASGILKKMKAIGVKPNVQTYNVLISLWGNSQEIGAGLKAEGFLHKLEDEYQNGNKDMRPTVVSYTSCINAWAKSSDHGKAERANAILDRMKAMHSSGVVADMPNEFSYTAVINACATTYGEQGEKQEAFRIAYSVFKEMSEADDLFPNHVTYSTFLKAISKLMPNGEKKDSMISIAFRLCIRDGQCDSNCLFQMKNAAPPELVSDLLGCSDPTDALRLTVDELPTEWTKNVKQPR